MKPYLIILICLSLSACGTVRNAASKFVEGGTDNSEPPTLLSEINEQLEINKLWSESIGRGSDEKYLKLAPKISEGSVYIAENRGKLRVLDSINGNTRWKAKTKNPITGGPGIDPTMVLVGTQEGEVLAFDVETGDELWSARVSSEVLSEPKVSDDIVVARTIDGKIYGINAETGKRLWVYDRTVPALTLRGTSAPVIDSGLVIAGFDGGRLAALELETGKLLWETRIAQGSGRSELDRIVDIDAEPIIDAGTIYVVTFQGNIAAVELETGRVQWSRKISSHAGINLNDDYIFVTDEKSHVWALDRFSGSSVWRQEKLQARAVTAPASIGNFVVVGDFEGYLHWMRSDSGSFVARNRINKSSIIAKPIAKENILYAYSVDGILGAFTYKGEADTESVSELSNEELEEEQKGFLEEDDDEGISLGELFDLFGKEE